ncbi:hypothetical protein Tco_0083933, partial [Tanacetum coccineum]
WDGSCGGEVMGVGGCGGDVTVVIWWWGDDGLEMEMKKVVRVSVVVTAVVALAVGGGRKLAGER